MVCCFGELLLRFSPASQGRWIEQSAMPVFIGGAELNVATALAVWDCPVKYITALPDNQLTADVSKYLNDLKINTSGLIFTGNRIGIYYLPTGADLKTAGVIYDRAESSFASLQAGRLNWNQLLDGCSWLHFSAIVPALSNNMHALCEEMLKVAKQKGIKVSIDLNYRSKLWQYGEKPYGIMSSLLKYCDVVMGNIWSAESLLGIESGIELGSDRSDEKLVLAANETISQLRQKFPQVKTVAFTFRMEHTYFAVLHDHSELFVSEKFKLANVVDKAGSGDCFMAGLIYGLMNNHYPLQIVNFSASAAVGKLSEKGDSTRQTIEQIQKRML